jgi:acyl-coenzyme A thioesterase PaaI-like protein
MTAAGTRAELSAALRDYRRARADYARTARDPHSLAHAAALIAAADAGARFMAARQLARRATPHHRSSHR